MGCTPRQMTAPFCLRLDLPRRASPRNVSRPHPPSQLFPCPSVAAWHFGALAPPPAPGRRPQSHSHTCLSQQHSQCTERSLPHSLTDAPHALRLSRDRAAHGHGRGRGRDRRGCQPPRRRLAYRAAPISPSSPPMAHMHGIYTWTWTWTWAWTWTWTWAWNARAWHVRGMCMARAWHVRGMCMARAWHVRGMGMARAWHVRGVHPTHTCVEGW